jgi:hypothetical protein
MKAVALAAKALSLADFQGAVKTFKVQLEDYMIVAKHLTTLYSNMLEHNLCRSVYTVWWCGVHPVTAYSFAGSSSPTTRCRWTTHRAPLTPGTTSRPTLRWASPGATA